MRVMRLLLGQSVERGQGFPECCNRKEEQEKEQAITHRWVDWQRPTERLKETSFRIPVSALIPDTCVMR